MNRAITVTGLVIVCLAAMFVGPVTAGDSAPTASEDEMLVVTGIVTARYGSTVTLKTDADTVYTVDTDNAEVMLDRFPGNSMSLRVGDRMQVHAKQLEPKRLQASLIQVFLSEAEAAATHAAPAGAGAGPAEGDGDVRLPSIGDSLGAWRSRGFVVDTNYSDRLVTIVTSKGPFVIDTRIATIVEAGKSVPLARLGQGDAVRVWGEVVGLNKIKADRIEIIRENAKQDSALPLKSVAVNGRITFIDYPSFTFRLSTSSGDLKFLADENTFIHFRAERKAFQNLAIGQVVKVSAIGSLNSGYVASEILVIGAPRN
ncbi:MAG: hypothetical protein HYX78_09395 [Armatimonadetes bacterium]|nr:hypothetical protein [Armatimonadota bacterium]